MVQADERGDHGVGAVPADGRGFLYGDSPVETVLAIDGRAVCASRPMERRQRGAQRLGIDECLLLNTPGSIQCGIAASYGEHRYPPPDRLLERRARYSALSRQCPAA